MNLIRRAILAFALIAGISPAIAQAPPPVPGLPDTERRTTYSISGTTCICNVNFALYGDSTDYQNWVEVYLNGALVNFNDATFGWTITSPTGPLAIIPRPVTDAVLTFANIQTGTVQIVGARRPRRGSQFPENRGVPARDLNQALTDIIAQNREIWDKTNDFTGRALISQPGNTVGLLPLPAACAGKFLGFDATGLIPTCTSGGTGTGNVVGPGSSVNGHFAIFSGTTGALLADHVIQGSDLPVPGASSLGGVQSKAAVTHNFLTQIGTDGTVTQAPPACADLSTAAASCSTDTTNASNIGSGTLNTARLPSPFTSGTASGNTSKFATVSGTLTNGHCASLDINGNIVDSGGPCSSAAMVLLNTLTASNSATLSDTTSLTGSFSVYEIVFENVLPATASTSCEIQVHSSAAFPATNYSTSYWGGAAGSATPLTGNPTTFIPCSHSGSATTAAPGINGTIRVNTPSAAAIHGWYGTFNIPLGSPNVAIITSGGQWNTSGVVDGFQVLFSSGNITSGVIKIYGIQ